MRGSRACCARCRRGPRVTVLGPGDDAAAIRAPRRPLLLTTDTLVEGVHFRARLGVAGALGRRALRVNAERRRRDGRPSALPRCVAHRGAAAAAGRRPRRADARPRRRRARALASTLVGGNLAAGRRLAITVTLVGESGRRLVTRAGARPGDDLWVTGTLGGAGAAVRDAARRPARAAVRRCRSRSARARLLAPVAHAMIDVSDGLVQDLGHVCRASRVAAEIDVDARARRAGVPSRPRRGRGAGSRRRPARTTSCSAPRPRAPGDASRAWRRGSGARLTRIGRIVAGRPGVRVLDARGRRVRLRRAGFDHFR